MTDHSKALNGRYQGSYSGINAQVQTSEFSEGTLRISTQTKTQLGDLQKAALDGAEAILAYRHSDTGELSGTSESLLPLKNIPWTEMPGIELKSIDEKTQEAVLHLWNQDVNLLTGKLTRVHFGKTIVYLKNFGSVDNIEWREDSLSDGPSQLHAQSIDHDLTIAPPSGSSLMVKQGQETEH